MSMAELEDDGINLDGVFEETTESTDVVFDETFNNDAEEEPKPKKRGRKPGTKIKKEEPSEETKTVTTKKRVDIDDLPPEIYQTVYNNYSKKSAEEIAKESNLDVKIIKKIAVRLDDLFQQGILGGDIDQNEYDSIIKPRLIEFTKKTTESQKFVEKVIKQIKKKK